MQQGLHQDLQRVAHLDRIGQLARPGLELLEGIYPFEEPLLEEPRGGFMFRCHAKEEVGRRGALQMY